MFVDVWFPLREKLKVPISLVRGANVPFSENDVGVNGVQIALTHSTPKTPIMLSILEMSRSRDRIPDGDCRMADAGTVPPTLTVRMSGGGGGG